MPRTVDPTTRMLCLLPMVSGTKYLRVPLLGVLCLGVTAFGQPAGLSTRVGNSTLRLPLNSPPTSYATTNAFGSLRFTDPLAITSPPGETNRLFIVEQRGRIAVITNLAVPTRTVFLDI